MWWDLWLLDVVWGGDLFGQVGVGWFVLYFVGQGVPCCFDVEFCCDFGEFFFWSVPWCVFVVVFDDFWDGIYEVVQGVACFVELVVVVAGGSAITS